MNNLRPTQSGTFSLVQRSLASNSRKLVEFQQQVATGRRILRASDDVIGSSRALSLRRQISSADRFLETISSSRPAVDAATSALEQAGTLLTEARTLLLQGMNGTLNQSDRNSIANQLELLLESLADTANTKSGEDFLFSGTRTGQKAFERDATGTYSYRGDAGVRNVAIGSDTNLSISVPGSDAFGRFEYSGVTFAGITGVSLGSSANQGLGAEELIVRHDTTTGTLGAGVTLANGGANDTIIATHNVEVDGVAGTVQIGNGEPVLIPSPLPADFVVTNESGAEVHLDLTGYTGGSFVGSVTGTGSISLDGVNFTAFNGTETDLRLVDSGSGSVLHVDVTGVTRAASELVHFEGTVDVFGVIQGIVSDLRNPDGLDQGELTDRLDLRLSELDRNHTNILESLGTLGGSAQRMQLTETQTQELDLNLRGLLSDVEDADFSELILNLSQTEQTLELAQLSGTRLLQTSLLNFLR